MAAGRRGAISRNERTLLHHMPVVGFSALIVAAPVAVPTRVEGIENDNIHMYRMFTKIENLNLDSQYWLFVF